MSWIDRLFGGKPNAVKAPVAPVKASVVHESASTGRRTRGVNAPAVSANALTLSAKTIRDRSRAAYRNDAFARGGIERLVTAVCGTGVRPLSQSPDPKFRRRLHGLWKAWTDEAGAGFTPDFYLPRFDLYLEVTTLQQRLVTKKNRKVRLLHEQYPDVRCKLLYRRDVAALATQFGLTDTQARLAS